MQTEWKDETVLWEPHVFCLTGTLSPWLWQRMKSFFCLAFARSRRQLWYERALSHSAHMKRRESSYAAASQRQSVSSEAWSREKSLYQSVVSSFMLLTRARSETINKLFKILFFFFHNRPDLPGQNEENIFIGFWLLQIFISEHELCFWSGWSCCVLKCYCILTLISVKFFTPSLTSHFKQHNLSSSLLSVIGSIWIEAHLCSVGV